MANGSASRDFWSPEFRLAVFILAATSIWSLLIEFFGWCSMRNFTLFGSLPALAALSGLALVDRAIGTRRLWRAVLVGAAAGLVAAVAYDVFRLPLVYADALGIQHVVPSLKLFKVFPRFGAMILGQPLEQPLYSLSPPARLQHYRSEVYAVQRRVAPSSCGTRASASQCRVTGSGPTPCHVRRFNILGHHLRLQLSANSLR